MRSNIKSQKTEVKCDSDSAVDPEILVNLEFPGERKDDGGEGGGACREKHILVCSISLRLFRFFLTDRNRLWIDYR